MRSNIVLSLIFMTIAICSATYFIGGNVSTYMSDLASWRDNAKFSPEGASAATLFRKGVDENIIEWNNEARRVVIQSNRYMSDQLHNYLFRVGEAGSIIASEIKNAEDRGRAIAIRVRRNNCGNSCDQQISWNLSSIGAATKAQATARAAAITNRRDVEPVPRLNALLSGLDRFGAWQMWSSHTEIEFGSRDLNGVDTIDIIGRLSAVPNGWSIEDFWCSGNAGVLTSCDIAREANAYRLHRDVVDVAEIKLVISPVNLLPENPPVGEHAHIIIGGFSAI